MRNQDLMILAAAGIAAYLILTKSGAIKGVSAGALTGNYNTTKVGDYNGWQYFSDGTAIGPDGAYYYQGQMVSPASYGRVASSGVGGTWNA